MAEPKLTLPEEVLVLVLRHRDGHLLDDTHYRFALAGAILTELLFQGHVTLEPGSSGLLVTPARKTSTGDPILDFALKQLLTATRRTGPERWIDRLAELDEPRMEVARQLCRKGVLDEHEGRVRLIFRRTVYVDLDPEVEEDVVGRVREAVFGDGPVNARTAMVTALARAGEILVAAFDEAEVAERKERLQNILDHAEVSEEMRDVARKAESALVSATRAAVKNGAVPA